MVQNGRLKLPTTNISNSFALEKDLWCVESQLQHILILRSPCTQNQDGKWQWQKMEIMYFAQNGIWLISAAILNTLDRRYWKNVPVQSQNVSPVDAGAKQVALIVRTYAPARSVRRNLTIKLQMTRVLMNLRKTMILWTF